MASFAAFATPGGGGTRDSAFIMTPKTIFRSVLPLIVAFALVPATMPAGEPSTPAVPPKTGKELLVIKDSQDAQTFNAEGQDVMVNGSRNKVTIKGTCHALTISGDANAVSVESVSSISITGEGNEVGWTKASDGERPQVTDLGKGNKVSRSGAKTE